MAVEWNEIQQNGTARTGSLEQGACVCRAADGAGELLMTSYEVFPGIVVIYKDARLKRYCIYMPETGTNLWSDAMVIPKNARNVELAHAFINYASDYDGAYDNSSYVGYTSANQEVMEVLSGEGGDYEGINAYIPRTDNPNDEVFVYNEETKKIIGDLWSRVKIAASNAD